MGYDISADVLDIVEQLVADIDKWRVTNDASVRQAFQSFVPGEIAPLEPGTRALVKQLVGQRFAARRKSHSTMRRVTASIDHPSTGRISEVMIEQLVSHPDYQHSLIEEADD